jgi:hypothetical protein
VILGRRKSTIQTYTNEGILAHRALEYVLKHDWNDAFKLMGHKFEEGTVTKEIAENIQFFINRAIGLISRLPKDSTKVMIEEELDLNSLGKPDRKGRVDFALIDRKNRKAYVWDYKHGVGESVKAINNQQLLYYGALLLRSLINIETIQLSICQPRSYMQEYVWSDWEIPVKKLEEWALKSLLPTILLAESSDNGLQLEHGCGHCHFCPALASCPLVQENVESIFDIEKAEDPIKLKLGIPNKHELKPLSINQLANLVSKFDTAKQWMKAAEDELVDRLRSGKVCDKAFLKPKQGNRAWIEGAEESLPIILSLHGIETDLYKEPKMKSPADIDKILKLNGVSKDELKSLTTRPISYKLEFGSKVEDMFEGV